MHSTTSTGCRDAPFTSRLGSPQGTKITTMELMLVMQMEEACQQGGFPARPSRMMLRM